MYSISAVIVNYLNYDVTINCVNSLKNNEPNVKIIIVDNNSSNESVNVLKKTFTDIVIIETTKNLGYANALNLGINYAKNTFNSNYIVILNSDIIVETYEVFEKSILKADDSRIGYISLACRNEDDSFQNPYTVYNGSILKMYIRGWLYRQKKRFEIMLKKEKKSIIRSFEYYSNDDYIINSAAGILTPYFFEKYNFLYTKTFFYTEEFCLFVYLKKVMLKTIYLNEGLIYHLENKSSESISKLKNKLKILSKASKKNRKLIFSSYNSIKKKYDYIDAKEMTKNIYKL